MSKGTGDEINLLRILNLFKKRWYVLVIAFAVSFLLCKLYLRYAPPSYSASATIRIEQERNPTQDWAFWSPSVTTAATSSPKSVSFVLAH